MESTTVETATASGYASWPIALAFVLVTNLAAYWANENSLLFRLCSKCCRMPSSFHATRTASGERTVPKPRTYWAWDALCPAQVVTSAWAPLPVLLLCRLSLLAYCVANLVVDGAMDDGFYIYWIVFYTHWTLIGMGLQGLVGSIVTAMHLEKKPQEVEWNIGIKLMLLLDQTVPSCALFLSLFYWGAVYSGTADAGNIMKHGINVLVMVTTFLLSQTPVVSYHFQAMILYVTVYVIFMWIFAVTTDIWPYEVLDLAESSSVVYYAIVPVLSVVCFYFWFLLGMLRDYVCYTLCQCQAYDALEPAAGLGERREMKAGDRDPERGAVAVDCQT